MKSMKEMISFTVYLLIWIFTFKLAEQLFDKYGLGRDNIIKICVVSIIILFIIYRSDYIKY